MSDSHSYSLQPWSSSPDPPRKPQPKAENPEPPTPTPAYPSTLPIPLGSPSTQALLKTPEIPRPVPTPPTMPRRAVATQNDASYSPLYYRAYDETMRRLMESMGDTDPDEDQGQHSSATIMPLFAGPMATNEGPDGGPSIGFGRGWGSSPEMKWPTATSKPVRNSHGSATASSTHEGDAFKGSKDAKHSAEAWPSRQSLPR